MVIDYPTWKPPSGISITYVCIPTGNLPLIRSNSKVTQFTPASNLKWDCLMAQGTSKWAFPTSQERVVSIGTDRTTGLFSVFLPHPSLLHHPARVSIIRLLLSSLVLSWSLAVLVYACTYVYLHDAYQENHFDDFFPRWPFLLGELSLPYRVRAINFYRNRFIRYRPVDTFVNNCIEYFVR